MMRISLALLWFLTSTCFADNWPQFRGPEGTGVAANADRIPTEWSESENLLWKTKLLGKGSSSPIIWGDRIFLTSYTGYGQSAQSPGDRSDLKRVLTCVDKSNGKILWTKEFTATHRVGGYANFIAHHGYASHTPVTDGMLVYVSFAKEGAFAFDFDGNQRWNFTDIGKGTGSYGSGGALALFKDLLIVNASAESESIIAVNKRSGEEVWRRKGVKECYNTPTILGDTLLVNGRDKLLGLDPRSGREKWSQPSAGSYICNSPTVVNGIAYVTHGGRGPTVALGPDGRKLWSANRGVTVPSPAVTNGLVFIPERDILTCLDGQTGDVVYRERIRLPITDRTYASPLVLGDRILVITRRDGAFIYSASRKFQLLAHNKIKGDDSLWNATPAVSDGSLYLRSETTLYCISNR